METYICGRTFAICFLEGGGFGICLRDVWGQMWRIVEEILDGCAHSFGGFLFVGICFLAFLYDLSITYSGLILNPMSGGPPVPGLS